MLIVMLTCIMYPTSPSSPAFGPREWSMCHAIPPTACSKISRSPCFLSHHRRPSCRPILVAASPRSMNRSRKLRASVWKMCCRSGMYIRPSWHKNEIDTVRNNMRLRNMGHVSPRFCSAETRSRKTKPVKVCEAVSDALYV